MQLASNVVQTQTESSCLRRIFQRAHPCRPILQGGDGLFHLRCVCFVSLSSSPRAGGVWIAGPSQQVGYDIDSSSRDWGLGCTSYQAPPAFPPSSSILGRFLVVDRSISFSSLPPLEITLTMPTAVVTGAGSGIGNAFARILIDEVHPPRPALRTSTPLHPTDHAQPRASKSTPPTSPRPRPSKNSAAACTSSTSATKTPSTPSRKPSKTNPSTSSSTSPASWRPKTKTSSRPSPRTS